MVPTGRRLRSPMTSSGPDPESRDSGFALRAPRNDGVITSPRHGVAHAGGEGVGQVAAKQLLDEIERIEKCAMHQDTSAAQRKKLRGLKLHDAVIVALAQTDLLDGCDLVAVDRQEFDFVLAA